jgi:hypothetical protein
MQLALLSTEESRFLAASAPADSAFARALAARLAALLGARLRRPVRLSPIANDPRAAAPVAPDGVELVWDAQLDALWLEGRLGCRPVRAAAGASAILGARLRRSLHAALAEVWRSHTAALPLGVLAFAVHADARCARIEIRFPDSPGAMQRWVQQTLQAHATHHAE